MKRIAALSLGVALLLGISAPSISTAAPQTSAPRDASDEILKDRILYRIDTDDILGKYDIKVSVTSGVATLTGEVATEAQRHDALSLARIDGISSVNNNLNVDIGTDKTLADRTKQGLNKAGEAITDAWITTKVSWFFVGEELLKGSNINVDTTDHVVTLKGTVRSASGRSRAVSLAKNTEGVARVVDQLVVSNTH